jgi:phytanoyl-CoA hydroxylase
VNKAYHGITTLGADIRRVHLEMDAGDTVFFHPILIHGSGANRTPGFRKSISCHYGSSHCKYIEVKGTSQETIAKEIEEILERRGIDGVSYQDVWRGKARLVGGVEDTL